MKIIFFNLFFITVTQPCSPIQTMCPQLPEINMSKFYILSLTYDSCYKCEDGWKQHGGKCYYFSTNSSSWNESRTECRTKGGDLVKIDSSEEQRFLQTKTEEFWIGLTDSAEEGRWLWVDGSPLNERFDSVHIYTYTYIHIYTRGATIHKTHSSVRFDTLVPRFNIFSIQKMFMRIMC
uniref:C-type lectin domain-containing protein n=1 Tax=Oreochromis niloticus TaxID=8128 RepID=A0A669CQC8_ORENI